MKQLVERLIKQFGSAEYAHAYMESHAVSRLAAQIYALRKQRGWSQKELAKRAGIAQERISKIETADFDSLTMKTLQKFASAFDVNLQISFGKFSDGVLDVANLKAEQFQVTSREQDLADFCQRRLLQGGDGQWKALDASHLTVCPISTAEPVAPSHEWKNIPTAPVMVLPELQKTA